jgi:hypothetical protein
MLNITYLSLLKILLTDYKYRDPLRKYYEIDLFFKQELGIIGCNELLFALLYFYNAKMYKKFLPPLQKGLKLNKLKKALESSSWIFYCLDYLIC